MHSSRVVSVLKTFSTKELTNFIKFVKSPYFNTHDKVIELAELLKDDAPKFNSDAISKANLLKNLYPKEKYTELKVNHLSSYLLRHLEDYLAHLNCFNDEFIRNYHLLRELRVRKLDPHFESIEKETRSTLKKFPFHDMQFYYYTYLLENEVGMFSFSQSVMKEDISLQAKMDNLDVYYILVKLRNSCTMLSQKTIITADYKLNMLEDVMTYLSYNIQKFSGIPIINIYYNIFMLLVKPEEENYYGTLKDLLTKNKDNYSVDLVREMYMYAQNYCAQKINNGHQQYLKELFNLNILLIEEKIVFIESYIPERVYENTVRLGLRLNEVQWTLNFIENYKTFINPENKNNAYSYNLSNFYYTIKEYDKALRLLNKVEFTDLFYNLGAKSLLLKIYYETNSVEPFLSLTDAFKIYLKRNKLISKSRLTSYTNFVKLVKSLFNLKLHSYNYAAQIKEEKIKKLEVKISATNPLANKKWLLDQLEKLGS